MIYVLSNKKLIKNALFKTNRWVFNHSYL